jgi:hypothetical protein
MKLNELLLEIIQKHQNKWVVFTHDHKKVLGTHSTYLKALAQLKAIEINKHSDSS